MSVKVSGLVKRFNRKGVPAVEQVSFEAPGNAITSLLGPSGSGKTTVLRIIAGLEEPDAGVVEIGGRDCTRLAPQMRGVGFVFQGYALFDHMNIRANIAFGLKAMDRPKSEIAGRVDELLTLVQLEGMGQRHPSQLSGGQRQRVAFARALATGPKVLLLDEPFGALDARVRLDLRAWLRSLHDRTHVTTLLVTHDQEEALELSDQVVLMHDGQVEQTGTPQQVYDHPTSPFAASFFGHGTFLKGSVSQGSASFGTQSFAPPPGATDGGEVHAFVRADDVRIRKLGEVAEAHRPAKILSLSPTGSRVRIELRLDSNETMTVHMKRVEFEGLGLSVGDFVIADLGPAKLFLPDYSI